VGIGFVNTDVKVRKIRFGHHQTQAPSLFDLTHEPMFLQTKVRNFNKFDRTEKRFSCQ
jgi:hypothetical protein